MVVSDQVLKIKRSWMFEERCTAVLFGAVFVETVYAPDCKKYLYVYETFVVNFTEFFLGRTSSWRPRISTPPETSMWSWGYCAQMKTTRTSSMRCDSDQGGFEKLMWYR